MCILSIIYTLQVLDLSYNNLTTIEGLDNLPIHTLKLRGNKITKLTGLDKLSNLSDLDVSENLIISLFPLEKCMNLTHLNVSSNQIQYIRQCDFLQNIKWLQVLIINNNPCEKKEFYRLRVLYRLPNLKVLDGVEACLENKVSDVCIGQFICSMYIYICMVYMYVYMVYMYSIYVNK